MEEGLVVCRANHVPLTPLSFLERAAFVYPKRIALIHGNISYSWQELHGRCLNLASALQLGVSLVILQLGMLPTIYMETTIGGDNDVAAVVPNVPALYELHFSVPMAGAVLSALNTQLDASTLAQILQQLGGQRSTGKPKGVVYSHRAAYLNAIADIFRYEMWKSPVFLWTVDMFRCNGWVSPGQ
ncbi:hypothetical protein HAX54_045672 [Datura stramonium]|uniref:Uncharacterized protein n=1 Tax=Datura stramonium TaxID=4076 RepID=A0ABS8RQ07_DATST|nr:hypothetical protein [Datura stramonium]